VRLVNQEPAIGRVFAVRRTLVYDGGQRNDERIVRIPVQGGPLRAELEISPTFQPLPDTRVVGAQVSFTFCPAKGPAPSSCASLLRAG
jgi:hypothetical protein